MTSAPTIYPEYCHTLSPTILKWVPLHARTIQSLTTRGVYDNGEELLYSRNHPIKWVKMVGVIVAVDDIWQRRVYTIDDSSGMCIECTCPAPTSESLLAVPQHRNQHVMPAPAPASAATQRKKESKKEPSTTKPIVPFQDLDVGVLVKVKGKAVIFRENKQVHIVHLEVLRSTEQEIKFWNEVLTFNQTILSQAWLVSREEEERCRRKALKPQRKESGEGRRRRKEAERKKRRQEKGNRSEEDEPGPEPEKNIRHKKKEMKPEPENRVNVPSFASRRRLKGKYDALGI
ncbi:hypothetical protein B0O99DRAFT_610447 [Bisporella sp. PMI_857]|nr:hypothetical protein B0O99DRAFT_612759 [Bisporella sp. PMI_857]KAH8600319.1 hypothetical protein B0O99DRAFT_610447 [Bisporella sp. PMI_857]